jgi:hypothetical protein
MPRKDERLIFCEDRNYSLLPTAVAVLWVQRSNPAVSSFNRLI